MGGPLRGRCPLLACWRRPGRSPKLQRQSGWRGKGLIDCGSGHGRRGFVPRRMLRWIGSSARRSQTHRANAFPAQTLPPRTNLAENRKSTSKNFSGVSRQGCGARSFSIGELFASRANLAILRCCSCSPGWIRRMAIFANSGLMLVLKTGLQCSTWQHSGGLPRQKVSKTLLADSGFACPSAQGRYSVSNSFSGGLTNA